MKRTILLLSLLSFCCLAWAQRESLDFNEGWRFAFGNAADPMQDFGCGTEYFNYLTKAASIHNTGPYSPDFDDSSWKEVSLPHDFVVDLPFAPDASHSHGYKTVGWKYPASSVGWYRKRFFVPESERGKRMALHFDGIFRDSRVWVNGFYCGGEPSGYLSSEYDVSDFLNYGGENIVCVRADASLEEGWFYEGGGIYRNVRLEKTPELHIAALRYAYENGKVKVRLDLENSGISDETAGLVCVLEDASGTAVASAALEPGLLRAQEIRSVNLELAPSQIRLWDIADPYRYRLVSRFGEDERVDRIGLRSIAFDADSGFFLNGRRVPLRGVNLHQDAAGLGSGIPDAYNYYRLERLRSLGCNAIRSSHNPMSESLLEACDSLGFLVIDENRLYGSSAESLRQLEKMILGAYNHPCVILWSVGNEEWGVEWNEKGAAITASLRERCHRLDSTRLMTVATSSGPAIVSTADVVGYNYLLQNKIDSMRKVFPQRIALASEETSGCGSRGVYYNPQEGNMVSLNRSRREEDGEVNRIESAWKFYESRPWLAGVFWWTGFDYRGEPNPLKYPATGSQYGILDYCGFDKDEAWYLRSVWTEEPVLHVFPEWNMPGMEGRGVEVWAYGNCDEAELWVNGKSLGRKPLERGGHLAWDAVYKPGKMRIVGYKAGKRVLIRESVTPGEAVGVKMEQSRYSDLLVCNLEAVDSKGRFNGLSEKEISFRIYGPLKILGVGNGNPAWRAQERPSSPDAREFSVKCWNGRAQILLEICGEGEWGIDIP